MSLALDLAALRHFAESGFFVAPSALAPALCDDLLAALSRVIAERAAAHLDGRQPERAFWARMPASAHRVEVFCDPSPGPLSALPAAAWESRAMRIGHGLHLVEPTFAAFCRGPALAAPLRRFAHLAHLLATGLPPDAAARATIAAPGRARLVQSAVIYKQPRSELVQFGFHRDSAYLPSEPESLVLAFVALDATTVENGCLQVIPRSHTEPLGLRYRLGPDGFVARGREPRPAAESALALPLPRGSIVFAHGRTLHASDPNRSSGPRRALIVHALAAASQLAPDAWVAEPPEGFAAIE